jgi:hypothetical protein
MVATKRSSATAVRSSKLAKFSPDAKFVVWSRAAYRRDGFHSYEGPGEREILAVFEDKAEANEAAKRLFYKKNPWGLSVDEIEEPEARMKNGMLYLMIHPDDSEVWEACVADRELFECKESEEQRKEEERQAAYDRDEEVESDIEDDDDELYGQVTKIPINPEDYLDGSDEDEDDEEAHTGGVQLFDIVGGLAAASESEDEDEECVSESEDEDEFTSEEEEEEDEEDFDEEEDLSEEDEEDLSDEDEDEE